MMPLSMPSEPIYLKNATPVASGNNREVFLHPDDPGLLIKTMKQESIDKHSGTDAPWTKKLFRRYKHHITFLRECQEHIVSRLDLGKPPYYLHSIVGFVDTDRGLGLVTRAVLDRTGNHAKNLQYLLKNGLFDDEARAAFDRFKADFIESRVIVTDMGMRNLLYAYNEVLGPHFVIIDGYGEKNLIPFNSLSPWCNRRSKKKRFARLERAITRETNKYLESVSSSSPVAS